MDIKDLPEYKPILNPFFEENLSRAHEAVLFDPRGAGNRTVVYDQEIAIGLRSLNNAAQFALSSLGAINSTFRFYLSLRTLYPLNRFVAIPDEIEPYVGESLDLGQNSVRTIMIPKSLGGSAIVLDTLDVLRGHEEGVHEFGSVMPTGRLSHRQVILVDLLRSQTEAIHRDLTDQL